MINEDHWLAPVFPLLRTGVWHITTAEGFLGILADAEILPSGSGRRISFPQTRESYAWEKRYVSLFDFEAAPSDELCESVWKWEKFFRDPNSRLGSIVIGVCIQRPAVCELLIPNEKVRSIELSQRGSIIPFVECWYPRPIPLRAVSSFLFMASQRGKPVDFLRLDAQSSWLPPVERHLRRRLENVNAG